MLPKPYRLPSPEIRRVFDRGERVNTPLFQLILLKNNAKTSRFAIVVPAGLDKRTTVRNRNRRLVREAIQKLLSEIVSGWDVVVLVRKDLSGMKQVQVSELLQNLLIQASIYS
jgi:ribonuclease P protein component